MAIELLFERKPSEEEVLAAMSGYETRCLAAWRHGRAYVALMDQGYTQKGIASAVGKSQTHVSLAARIYRGLHPRAHETLCRLGVVAPDVLKIAKIAGLRDDDEKPDEAAQLFAIQKIISKARPRNDQGLERTVVERFLRLREMQIRAHPVVAAVIQYLSGEALEITWPSTTETPPPPRQRTSRSRSTS